METPRSGQYVSQGDYKAFIPKNLPPNPPIQLDESLEILLTKAQNRLNLLDGLGASLPNSDLFKAMNIRKEALLSAQIEGTQASLEDIFKAETGMLVKNRADVAEVINYIKALHYGIDRLNSFPMSLRLIKELHRILLEGTGGADKSLGEFRRSQNWIGPAGCTLFTAAFVPPPAHMVPKLMGELENYAHASNSLIDCALIHYQFETIHPFLDGNGRLGRLLITFYFLWKNQLRSPLLYLSYFLKLNRQEYYDRLTMVRTTGNYEQWVAFFLKGVTMTCESAITSIKEILQLQDTTQNILIAKQSSMNALKLLNHLFYVPIISVGNAQKQCEISFQGASNLIREFEALGILKEITGQKRAKRYVLEKYLTLLSQGTQPF